MLFKERLHCPVCDEFLGIRDKNELYIAHCQECSTTYSWYPRKAKPIAELDKCKPQKCGCGRCGR